MFHQRKSDEIRREFYFAATKNMLDDILFSVFASYLGSHFWEPAQKILQLRERTGDWHALYREVKNPIVGRYIDFKNSQKGQELISTIRTDLERNRKWVHLNDREYPKAFKKMQDRPFYFCYLGRPVWLSNLNLISIVGSREPGMMSVQWLQNELNHFLQAQEVGVISGGARGVDQLAHLISLRNKRPTLVVLPSGLNQPYPKWANELTQRIVEGGGCLMSEFFPDEGVKKHYFQRRNRLIAALGVLTLLIDARAKSGTLITAQHAIENGKPLLILPSHPYDANARGGLNLISEGATMVRDAQDLAMIFDAESKALLHENPH